MIKIALGNVSGLRQLSVSSDTAIGLADCLVAAAGVMSDFNASLKETTAQGLFDLRLHADMLEGNGSVIVTPFLDSKADDVIFRVTSDELPLSLNPLDEGDYAVESGDKELFQLNPQKIWSWMQGSRV